jgi:rare lipoprotein A
MSYENSKKLMERIRREGDTRRKRIRASLLAVALGVTATVVASTPSGSSSKLDVTTKANDGSVGAAKAATTPVKKKKRWFEIGKASWYGGSFNGRKTADGERYDMTGWTCAHRTLPLGSWVKVTNLYNRKSIYVRVNDRGPMVDSRIVDLSYAAARKLGISGLGQVKLEKVSANDPKLIDQMTASVRTPNSVPWPVPQGMLMAR